MSLKVAFQMDHVAGLDIAGDTTFALMLEAQARGHTLYHYTPERLSMRTGRVEAGVEEVTVRDETGNHADLGDIAHTELATMDVTTSGSDVPMATIVKPITSLLTPSQVATATAPSTSHPDPNPNSIRPPINNPALVTKRRVPETGSEYSDANSSTTF